MFVRLLHHPSGSKDLLNIWTTCVFFFILNSVYVRISEEKRLYTYSLGECRFKVWPLNPSILKTYWQHLGGCWLMLSKLAWVRLLLELSIYEFKVKAETPGQESALVSCMVTPFSAVQTYSRDPMIACWVQVLFRWNSVLLVIFPPFTLGEEDYFHSRNYFYAKNYYLKIYFSLGSAKDILMFFNF